MLSAGEPPVLRGDGQPHLFAADTVLDHSAIQDEYSKSPKLNGPSEAADAADAAHIERQRSDSDPANRSASAKLDPIRSAIGLHPEAPIDEDHDVQTLHLLWPKFRAALREPLTEFCGTVILVLFGDASVAQVVLSNSPRTGGSAAPGGSGFGNYQSINWAWGIGLMLGIYVAGDSGAYLNPAVTFTNCIFRQLPWRRFPIYLVAQFLGGFVAAAIVYANYVSAIDAYAGVGVRTVPPASTATGQIFCTYPQAFLPKVSQFFSEFITSAILMFVIFALKDDANNGVSRGGTNFFPLALFFLIFGLGSCFGWETGYAINLARDFGPRLMSYALGYRGVWSAGNYYFWVPIVGSFTGCAFGGFLYDLLIYTGPESPLNTEWMGLKKLVFLKTTVRERRKRDRVVRWEPEDGKAEVEPPS